MHKIHLQTKVTKNASPLFLAVVQRGPSQRDSERSHAKSDTDWLGLERNNHGPDET